MKEISLEKITALKETIVKDIVIFGSGSVVSQFTNLKLIDEYKFLDVRKFDNGKMMLHYRVKKI